MLARTLNMHVVKGIVIQLRGWGGGGGLCLTIKLRPGGDEPT